MQFIALENGQMNYMKLLKLLYMLDRSSLIKYGRPVTFDAYVSMKHGPVLSFTYDKMCYPPDPGESSYWNASISEHDKYIVKMLKNSPEKSHLSAVEEDLIQEIYASFGSMNQYELSDHTHDNFPEWKDPKGSAIPIYIQDILIAGGYSEEDANEVVDSLEAEMSVKELR